MNRIDDLVQELCPNGVPHFPLSVVAEYSTTRVNAEDIDETTFVGVDNLVADKGGRVDANYSPNTARLTAYVPGDILLGNIRPYLKKVWRATNAGGCSGDVLAIRITRESRQSLDSFFLYYLLSSNKFFAYNMKHAKGAKMPRGNKAAILNYRIPLPPIEVQREIVRVLDQFTELEAELEAELESRNRQRVALVMNFAVATRDCFMGDGANSIVTLGQIATQRVESLRLDADTEYVSLGVKWNGEGTLTRPPRYGREIKSATMNIARAGQLIYNRMFAVEGSFAIVPAACDGAVVSNEFPLFELDTQRVDPYWLMNFFQDPHTLARIESEVTGVERGSMKARRRWKEEQFAKFEVQLPSMAEQQRIADVLRASDVLIKSLNDELNARRKQYEHYRDRLLTFKELAV